MEIFHYFLTFYRPLILNLWSPVGCWVAPDHFLIHNTNTFIYTGFFLYAKCKQAARVHKEEDKEMLVHRYLNCNLLPEFFVFLYINKDVSNHKFVHKHSPECRK